MARRKLVPGIPVCEQCRQQHVVHNGTSAGQAACAGHRAFETVDGKRVPLPKKMPCRTRPRRGQAVCGAHGGRAPQSKAAAETRIAEAAAAKAMITYGRPIETTATEALLDEVKWTAGHVAWLRERVQELEMAEFEAARLWDDEDMAPLRDMLGLDAAPRTEKRHTLIWGQTREKTGGDDRGSTFEAKPNAFLVLYQQERTHLIKVCAAAISAGIEERKVRLAEQQGQLVADVIRRILTDLRLTPEQQATVSEVVPRHLRLLSG